MGYALGVDLGTTYTAAAVCRDGNVEIATLGNRSAAVPSVVLLREDETILTGDAASRRGVTEPDRVAREFKRRVGDTTPIFLGGAPYSAETLMGKLLRWVVDEVAQREGGPADATIVSHPANWGAFKKDLLEQAMRQADLQNASTITEPEAAAVHYASTERVEPGDVVAVYDLGGGTFDAAVLRKTAGGFEILGTPEGVERLGGIDFDSAVFAHVVRALGGAVEALDEDDPAARAAVARLRQECVDAKEALSTDTDVSIPVLLPDLQTEVRLTRAEFETMVRPTLVESIHAMHRALRGAGVAPDEVKAVLLVGGSSRIPLVAQLVGAEFGRPVAVDAHPKHSIALGAALAAAGET
ncbi:MAG TPA: Hsp70 family protein, partial [Acidimicrobiia bacterium]